MLVGLRLRMKRTESGSSGARDPKASAESTKELLSAEFSELCWIQQQSLKASAHRELSWTTYFETLPPQTEIQVTIRKLNGTRDLYFGKIDHLERFWTHSLSKVLLGEDLHHLTFRPRCALSPNGSRWWYLFNQSIAGRWSKFRWGIDFVSNLQNNITHESFLRKLVLNDTDIFIDQVQSSKSPFFHFLHPRTNSLCHKCPLVLHKTVITQTIGPPPPPPHLENYLHKTRLNHSDPEYRQNEMRVRKLKG